MTDYTRSRNPLTGELYVILGNFKVAGGGPVTNHAHPHWLKKPRYSEANPLCGGDLASSLNEPNRSIPFRRCGQVVPSPPVVISLISTIRRPGTERRNPWTSSIPFPAWTLSVHPLNRVDQVSLWIPFFGKPGLSSRISASVSSGVISYFG
jgi:hypothetical protein